MTRYRWGMIALCFMATTINYIDRATFGVAAVAIQTELKIDPAIMGIILGGFFWIYALMQMPSGYLIDRFVAGVVGFKDDVGCGVIGCRVHRIGAVKATRGRKTDVADDDVGDGDGHAWVPFPAAIAGHTGR
jgi:MFS family permease